MDIRWTKFRKDRQKSHGSAFSLIHRQNIHKLWKMWILFSGFRKVKFLLGIAAVQATKNMHPIHPRKAGIPGAENEYIQKGGICPQPCGWTGLLFHTLSFCQKADRNRVWSPFPQNPHPLLLLRYNILLLSMQMERMIPCNLP